MDSVYIMQRMGKFKPYRSTSNQCKAPGHSLYFYRLKMVFNGNMKLDDRKFIIDHQDIDDLIQRLKLRGSCEEMHLKISRQLQAMMKNLGIDMLACKCVIDPGEGAAARLEFISTKDPKYLAYLT